MSAVSLVPSATASAARWRASLVRHHAQVEAVAVQDEGHGVDEPLRRVGAIAVVDGEGASRWRGRPRLGQLRVFGAKSRCCVYSAVRG